jgi:hypothetical protein
MVVPVLLVVVLLRVNLAWKRTYTVIDVQRPCSTMTPTQSICLLSSSTWPVLSTVAQSLDPSKFQVIVARRRKVTGAPSNAIPAINAIQVTVSYPYQSITPWLSSLDATVTKTATYFN